MNRSRHALPGLALLGLLTIGTSAGAASPEPLGSPAAATAFEFVPTGSLAAGRIGHTATLLPDGRVLVIGGYYTGSAELWDPDLGTWSEAGRMAGQREGHTSMLLTDGRVLVRGGHGEAGDAPAAEVWDPGTRTFTLAADPNDTYLGVAPTAPVDARSPTREGASRTTLPDGRVLVAGGRGPSIPTSNRVIRKSGLILDTAELWDPQTGAITSTSSLVVARTEHTATLLQDGRVLIVGSHTHGPDDSTAEVFQPVP